MHCDYCGEKIPAEEEHTVLDDYQVCKECYESYNYWWVCDKCGHLQNESDDSTTVQIGDGYTREYCESCFQDSNVIQCDNCSEWLDIERSGQSNSSGTEHLCGSCVERGWGFCENCDVMTDDLDCDGYCPDCRGDEDDGRVHDYGYRPDLEFWETEQEPPGKPIYLGFELEVDVASRDDIEEDGEYISQDISEEGVCWCTEDGSLLYGFELTSHPMTLRYHKESNLWKDRFRRLVRGGWRSYDVSSCGFHVHVNRNALAKDTWIAMSDWIQEGDIRTLIRKVAQRKSTYANFYEDEAEEQHCDVDTARSNILSGWRRYAAINFANDETIEFRVFKGSLKYERVLSYLEFVDAIVRYFRILEEINFEIQPKYADFLQHIKDNPDDYGELIQKLKDKGFIPTEEGEQQCLV